METIFLYTVLILLSVLTIKNRLDLRKYRKSVRRAKFDYEKKVAMWDDMKFKMKYWENDKSYILKTLNTLAKQTLRIDEELYDLTKRQSKFKSDVIHKEIMKKHKLDKLGFLDLKSDEERYRKERRNAIDRIKRKVNSND